MNIPSYELERIERECREAGVLEEYRAIVAKGTPPRAAAMYALQSPAGTRNTDRAFCQGQRAKMENMTPNVAKMLHQKARRAGINTSGKYYMSGLGRHTDPAAWVSCAEDVLTVAKAKNLTLEGVLNRKGIDKEVAPKPNPGVAPDIVNELARKQLAKDPSLRARCQTSKRARQELRESIIDKHARKNRPAKPFRLAR